MLSMPRNDRCLECGDTVDDGFAGWGEPYPVLCYAHGMVAWSMKNRCDNYLQKEIRCARPDGHPPPHIHYPIAWN